MKLELKFREALKPFIEMVKSAKQTNNVEFIDNIDKFIDLILLINISGIKEHPQFIEKFLDEINDEK